MLEHYIDYLRPGTAELVEHEFTLHLDGNVIKGRIDRVDKIGKNLKVSDYKTSRSEMGWDEARDSLQLAIYYKAAREDLKLAALGKHRRRLCPVTRGRLPLVPVQADVPAVGRGQGATAMNPRELRTSPAIVAALNGYEPTDEQWGAISHPLEPAHLVAGAGSGKTAVMAARIVWTIEAEGSSASRLRTRQPRSCRSASGRLSQQLQGTGPRTSRYRPTIRLRPEW